MNNHRPSLLPCELDKIPFGEKLLLWAARIWIKAFFEGTNPYNFLIHGFKLAKVTATFPAFESTMSLLTSTNVLISGFRPPNCPEISIGEQHFLGAIAAIQTTGRQEHAEAYLACWVPTSAIRLAIGPLSQLSKGLAEHNLWIRPRQGIKLPQYKFDEVTGDKLSPKTVH